MNFRKLSSKILGGYIVIVLIFMAITGISYFQLKSVESKVNQLTSVEFTFFQIYQDLAYNIAERGSNIRGYMLYGKQDYADTFNQLTKETEDLEQELLSMSDSKENKDLTNRNLAWSKAVKEELIPSIGKGNPEETMRIATKLAPETKSLVKSYADLAQVREDNIEQITKEVVQKQNSLITILFISNGLAVLLSVFLGLLLARSITKPIQRLVEAAEKIADGDLNVEIKVDTKDEIGHLAMAFDKMSNNLNDVMYNISSAAEQVASGSKQVSDSSMMLSQGATEQASSIEQLTASLEEISTQTKNNAHNANEANNLAENAQSNALSGNNQMKQMLQAMDEINDSSNNISKIIKVIDEIAFQTNILALNAAVEAARAGSHGKGFAVVAEEVRNLAARSANAAKETTDMIEGSIKKVEDGTKIASETAGALNNIVEGIAKVAELINGIAIASNDQATSIAQINQGISQVAAVVQNNSATSEESAAASEELASQAELLKDQVERFQLKKGSQAHSFKGLDDIDPEVIKLLSNKKKHATSPREHYLAEAAATSPKKIIKKIALSDSEFGKY